MLLNSSDHFTYKKSPPKKVLKLCRYRLMYISADFWLSLFKKMSEDAANNGVYDFTKRTVG